MKRLNKFPVTKSDVMGLLIMIISLLAVIGIRYAVFLPRYL